MSEPDNKPERTSDAQIDQLVRDFGKKPDPQDKVKVMEYLKKQRGLYEDLHPDKSQDKDRGRDR